jgi:thiosulfate/3-mercaptopyruvate sulfurtransferase
MNPLVTSAWLAGRLGDPNTKILDATLPLVGATPPIDTHARYLEQHIPGAVFFDIEKLSDHSTPLPHMLPKAEEFSRRMSELGVGDRIDIVVYEQGGVFSAPRAWWMLRTFGAQNVFLLDGGLPAWIEAGLPTEAGEVDSAPASFGAKLNSDAVRDFAQIEQLIAEHGQILDARSAGRFSGAAPEPVTD